MYYMSFIEYLDPLRIERGWTWAKLARQSGISPSAIYLIKAGARNPGIDVCDGIAGALHLPPEQIYRAAGILPSKPEADALLEELIFIFKTLDPDLQHILVRAARGIQQGEEKGLNEKNSNRGAVSTPIN